MECVGTFLYLNIIYCIFADFLCLCIVIYLVVFTIYNPRYHVFEYINFFFFKFILFLFGCVGSSLLRTGFL